MNRLIIGAGFFIVFTIFYTAFDSAIKIRDLKAKNESLKKTQPYISIARVRIDSVDTTGKVFATELHAGEVGSSGDGSFQTIFEPTFESKRWAESKYYVPEEGEVFVMHMSMFGKDTSYLITPSW